MERKKRGRARIFSQALRLGNQIEPSPDLSPILYLEDCAQAIFSVSIAMAGEVSYLSSAANSYQGKIYDPFPGSDLALDLRSLLCPNFAATGRQIDCTPICGNPTCCIAHPEVVAVYEFARGRAIHTQFIAGINDRRVTSVMLENLAERALE
jgi:hypothetical protein